MVAGSPSYKELHESQLVCGCSSPLLEAFNPLLTCLEAQSPARRQMKLFSLAATVPLLSLVMAQNNTAANNNYLGSTPSQRHYVNATQAGQIVQAAALESANISIPVNIAVTDPSGLVRHRFVPCSMLEANS